MNVLAKLVGVGGFALLAILWYMFFTFIFNTIASNNIAGALISIFIGGILLVLSVIVGTFSFIFVLED